MRPNFLTECLDDIQRIKEHIALRSPTAGQQFVDAVFDRVEQLLDFPQLGRMVPELGHVSVREILYRQYRIIYRLLPNGRIDIIMVQSGLYPLDANRLA